MSSSEASGRWARILGGAHLASSLSPRRLNLRCVEVHQHLTKLLIIKDALEDHFIFIHPTDNRPYEDAVECSRRSSIVLFSAWATTSGSDTQFSPTIQSGGPVPGKAPAPRIPLRLHSLRTYVHSDGASVRVGVPEAVSRDAEGRSARIGPGGGHGSGAGAARVGAADQETPRWDAEAARQVSRP